MRKIVKLYQTKAASIDEANKSVTFKISDNDVDRMGEKVDQKTWNFKDYEKNPIVLWGHNPDEPENVLGTAKSLEVAKDGSHTLANVKFDTDINPKAELVFNQVKRGTLRTVSVGFMNHTNELEDDTPVLKDNDLLEISVVPIPANPRAIALEYEAGGISRKDMQWLVDGYTKEAEYLREELEKQDNDKEVKPMDEAVSKQLSALLEAVTVLTEAQTKTNERLETLATQFEEEQHTKALLPKGPLNKKWDADAARKRVQEWAADKNDEHGTDWKKYSRAFFWFDKGAPDPDGDGYPDEEYAYKLPFADVIDGELKAIWHGVMAAYEAVQGARGGVQGINDEKEVLAKIQRYYDAFGKPWPLDDDDHKKPERERDEEEDAEEDKKDGKDLPIDAAITKDLETAEEDVANGGENDQPGATTDVELDPEAELTPETKALIDSALEEVELEA